MKATSNFGLKCQVSPYFGLPRIDLRSICDYWFRHHVWVERAQTSECVSEWRMKIPVMWFSARLQEHFNFRLLKENTWLEKSFLVSIKVQDKSLQYLMVRPQSIPAGLHMPTNIIYSMPTIFRLDSTSKPSENVVLVSKIGPKLFKPFGKANGKASTQSISDKIYISSSARHLVCREENIDTRDFLVANSQGIDVYLSVSAREIQRKFIK